MADPETHVPAARLTPTVRIALSCLGAAGLAVIIVQTFNLSLFGVFPLLANRYYYVIIGLFLAAAFLINPARRDGLIAPPVSPADLALVVLSLLSCGYLSYQAETIITSGWDVIAPPGAAAMAGLLVLLSLEAVRRTAGVLLLAICALFAAYPLFADIMPAFLWGPSLSLSETVAAHAMGMESIIGIPLRVVADTLVGFIIFGSVLAGMGGGQFFMDLSLALMGRSRGGAAKVAILSSGLFGSLSGSVISNVLTTGRLTIPAMQKAGYPPRYAAAAEACASTGGTLMPPVMGAVAFIMASFLDVPYTSIMVAALVPALLYYVALLLQVDLYAARNGLTGQPDAEKETLAGVLTGGWHHLASLGGLVALLFAFSPSRSAYYATALMLVLALLRHRRLPKAAAVMALLQDVTGNIAHLVATLCGIGMVVGALAITGVGSAFSRELIQYGGENVPLLLVLGAVTSFVLGMGMTVSACYIFLATLLAPALVELGLDPIGSHLFVLYWGMLSYITPPVALAAITAAQISGASAMQAGFTSMRLGATLFVLPFVFVYQPALLLNGPAMTVIATVGTAALALALISCAFEAYLYGAGRIGFAARAALFVAGALLLIPDRTVELAGLAVLAGTVAGLVFLGKGVSVGERGQDG
ncbi:TRAP transporter, 4TM/12TM fusion protein [Lutimaribacter pacificus]|uniref:TRAP transporter, 4TM/12TM fusion protein n=1 Tax=Lutimaribacter pacificus TaxID=391948 RepID=A0A1H0D4P5_9RHOB|nr:TRAP transporter fused permease subunit [Lutimaribacter pacificus]SDN65140.1 TRAP transporter, 4TM/12TM fusion protein [Lutimaribacter pacificus]SHJ36881.1 TRAP transporter, 4TM/12TM fusion protein [Lutimaribacter pacificus]